jgi:hypothetical protein
MSEMVEITVDILRETDKAFLVSDGDNETWLAKSQIEYDFDKIDGEAPIENISLEVPLWIAEKEGFV